MNPFADFEPTSYSLWGDEKRREFARVPGVPFTLLAEYSARQAVQFLLLLFALDCFHSFSELMFKKAKCFADLEVF